MDDGVHGVIVLGEVVTLQQEQKIEHEQDIVIILLQKTDDLIVVDRVHIQILQLVP